MENPFYPSFGRVPNIYLDRQQTVKDLAQRIQNINSPFMTTLIYGMRGSGKTSFLSDISQEIRQYTDWIVVDLSQNDNLVPYLITSVYKQVNGSLKKMIEKIGGFSISAGGMQLSYQTKNNPSISEQSQLFEMAEALEKHHLKLLITIDEIVSSPSLKQFASIYQLLLRRNFHIALVMAGLPNRVSELQNNDVLTFLLRSKRIYLEPLTSISMVDSYTDVFSNNGRTITFEVAAQMVKLTMGYAYAFQLLGYLVWETGKQAITNDVLQSILPEYKNELFKSVYFKIFQELTGIEKQFVESMAKSPDEEVDVNFIQKEMGKDKSYISVYRRRLINSQIINSPAHGKLAFTLPFFKEFIQKNSLLY